MNTHTVARSKLLAHPRRNEIVEVRQHLLLPINVFIDGVGILHTHDLSLHEFPPAYNKGLIW
jgi:hypothetical protein